MFFIHTNWITLHQVNILLVEFLTMWIRIKEGPGVIVYVSKYLHQKQIVQSNYTCHSCTSKTSYWTQPQWTNIFLQLQDKYPHWPKCWLKLTNFHKSFPRSTSVKPIIFNRYIVFCFKKCSEKCFWNETEFTKILRSFYSNSERSLYLVCLHPLFSS